MKRTLIGAVIAIFLAMPAFSRETIEVECGDMSIVNNKDIVATLKFDYTNMIIEEKPYMEYLKAEGEKKVEEWPSQVASSEARFVKCWNKENKKGMQVTTEEGGEYTLVVVISDLNMGSTAASFWIGLGAGGAKMSGMMYILKGNSNVPVLTMSIDGQTGKSGVSDVSRQSNLYGALAEDLLDRLKEMKKSTVPASTEAVVIPCLQNAGN